MARGRPGRKQGDVLLKSAEMIGWALGGLEREITQTRERLNSLTTQANTLRAKLGKAGRKAADAVTDTVEEPTPRGGKRRRRKMSPEARKRIADMMKKRWAERKKKGLNRL